MKMCVRCEQYKPLDEFVLARMNKSGRSNRCKKCHSTATMHALAQKRQKPTAYPTTDRERSAILDPAHGRNLDRYWRIPNLSHLGGIPRWRQ